MWNKPRAGLSAGLIAASCLATPAMAARSDDGPAVWTATHASPAIQRGGVAVAVEYAAPRALPGSPLITQVHAGYLHRSAARVAVKLCWNGTRRCIPVEGASFNTNAFNGLRADKPLYLLYTADGDAPLAVPVHVRGTLTVWYGE